MKKLYLSMLLLGATGLAFAQGSLVDRPGVEEHFPTRNFGNNHSRAFSEWYNYGEEIYNFGGDVSYFRMFAWPDSTVFVEFSSGLGRPWKHSTGQVFDPFSAFFDVNHSLIDGAYSVDSVAIPYRYFRVQDGAPDTVFVQFYEESSIYFQPDPGWTSGASYATLDYDYTVNKGVGAFHEETILLTNDDTIMSTHGYIELPVFKTIADSQHFAITVTYKPGNPYNFNDTIDTYFVPQPVNQRNAFILYEFRDNDKNVEQEVYNNALTATTDVRYNTNTNGWNGSYIAGTAWNNGFYSMDVYFLVSNPPTGIEENAENFRIRTFPNPTNGMLNVRMPQLKGNTQYQLINTVGQVVMAGSVSDTQMELDMNGLTSGIYSLNFIVDGKLHSTKVSKY